MPSSSFGHVDTWIFDLDNTLYPADCNLFREIDERMTLFIEKTLDMDAVSARTMQKQFYADYGTTLSGLMHEHGIAPQDFMSFVHDIDLSPVDRNEALASAIAALPGKRYIFTNGSVKHAENVAGKIGILELFDDVFDIEKAGFVPKPHQGAYDLCWQAWNIDPKRAAMFEDMPQNLEVPHAAGMETVLVQSQAEWCEDEPEGKRPSRPGERFDHVNHVTSDLTQFLSLITRRV
ncbi:pyrimidine 5'-nucleotidase [Parvularcula sp. LCG005]|uniref:pyrimidine 5'-nucleotidase n=1 Tax=Parvularcula sp. LCG005 TaxID=3078805 RepID=UPI002943CE67|nr:pyrimidine 5'-nucleotidase [Parvularcula sp. LCG005]WOI53170.1 pyrimidine 5'-nucleotidase [Parvularcula sp. LCG005]